MINALTFDVEEWFQANSFSSRIKFSEWHYQESRIEKNVYKILGILRRNDVKATFFVLGWIAEKFPDLVENIAFEGHEIASHGYRHKMVHEQTPQEFEEHLIRSIRLLRNITGQNIMGYRAPNFSITKKSIWALKILERNGIKYDSSIFPAQNKYCGIANSQQGIHKTNLGIIESPISKTRIIGKSIITSGEHIRLFPYMITKSAIKKINKEMPAIIHINTWETDKKQPGSGMIDSIRHYGNTQTTIPKIKKLLKDFQFDSMRNVLFGDKEELF